MCWTQFEHIRHSSKILGPSRKTLRPSWYPKLVTGLVMDFNCGTHVSLSLIVNIYGRIEIQNVINLKMCHVPGD